MSYLGFDVLPVQHNMRENIAEAFARSGELVSSPTGKRVFDDRAGVALPTRTFQWTCLDRAAAVEMRAFLVARKGRAVPFWAPTCCWDLELAADAPSGTSLTVKRAGYYDYLWSLGAPRRHLAIFPRGGAMLTRKVTDCVAADFTTETLTLDATTGVALAAARTVISFLVLCRLADDLTDIDWSSPTLCEASLRFVELPREVPA